MYNKPGARSMSQNFIQGELASKRVITNMNMKDFEKVFVRQSVETKETQGVRKKAHALLQVVAEEEKSVRKFFEPEIGVIQGEAPIRSKFQEQGGKQKSNTIDFYGFYQDAIKGRVRDKLKEEEDKKIAIQNPATIPAVTINLDEDETHPPIISISDSPQATSTPPVSTPPRKMPRRRGGGLNLGSLGQNSFLSYTNSRH
eukprot:TRINITY_DN44265_c0_g1_i5.p1 TRINITY_DN44265_c0_g1~~TRINITY_DN44265_c0_g1_i5.p1  ORF type:complete len:212 (-),score=36.78 TRINITY_DN44265_c0_g1_i5:86-685(-)